MTVVFKNPVARRRRGRRHRDAVADAECLTAQDHRSRPQRTGSPLQGEGQSGAQQADAGADIGAWRHQIEKMPSVRMIAVTT